MFYAISNITKQKIPGGGGGGGSVDKKKRFINSIVSHFISRFMLFSTLKKNIEKCPITYWLNGRWFLQIVDRDSGNLYPIYPLFPCCLGDRVALMVW